MTPGARALLFGLAVFWPARARAQVEASGYLKNLYQYSRGALDGRPYWQDLTRARLTLEGSVRVSSGPRLTAHADYDHELRVGTFLRTLDYRTFGLAEPSEYFDMGQTIASGSDALYRHRLYRGWVQAEAGGSALRFGRQRVAWGTGKLWNPTDIVNPFQPTLIERDERFGVDAAYARAPLGELGQAEAVYTLADSWPGSDLLARVHGNASGVDLSALAGKTYGSTGSWVAGGDFSVDVYGGNLHGELAYFDPRTRVPYWKGLLGYEYQISSAPPWPWLKDLWVLGEYFRNGSGASDTRFYNPAVLLQGREVALARDYLGFGLRKELHPLVQLEIYQLFNLDDGSVFLNPFLDWNALRNLHLMLGWQRFGGTRASEYGRLANIAYAQAQYFF